MPHALPDSLSSRTPGTCTCTRAPRQKWENMGDAAATMSRQHSSPPFLAEPGRTQAW